VAPAIHRRAEAGNGGYPDPGYFSDGAYMAVGCSDATVSGDGTYRSSDGAVRCRLTVTAGRRRFDVALSWSQRSRFARARLGHAVLSLPAP
jgi:hypothetical protein